MLPFCPNLARFLDSQKDRVFNKNKASLIIIEGGVGLGKTTLAVHIADYINGSYKKNGKDYHVYKENFISFAEVLGLGGDDFNRKIIEGHKAGRPVVIYDEAGDYGKRTFLTELNIRLNRIFELYRALKVVVVLCLPSFDYLDRALLDKNVPRGLISIEKRNKKFGQYSFYDLYKMNLLKGYFKNQVIKKNAYKWVNPNFRGRFVNLDKKRSEALDKYSTAGKLKELESFLEGDKKEQAPPKYDIKKDIIEGGLNGKAKIETWRDFLPPN